MAWIIIIVSLISPLLSLTKVSVGNKTFILHTENGDCYENSTFISGGDLDKKTEITGVENAFHCLDLCREFEHEGCKYYSWTPEGSCWLKKEIGERSYCKGCVTGRISCKLTRNKVQPTTSQSETTSTTTTATTATTTSKIDSLIAWSKDCTEKQDWLKKEICSAEVISQCLVFDQEYPVSNTYIKNHFRVPSPAGCQKICQEKNSCKYWYWKEKKGKGNPWCSISSREHKDPNLKFTMDSDVSGPSLCVQPTIVDKECKEKQDWLTKDLCSAEAISHCLEYDETYSKYNLFKNKMGIVSPTSCLRKCKETSVCGYWYWYGSIERCSLSYRKYNKTTINKHFILDSDVSGPSLCGADPTTKTMTKLTTPQSVITKTTFKTTTNKTKLDECKEKEGFWRMLCLFGYRKD